MPAWGRSIPSRTPWSTAGSLVLEGAVVAMTTANGLSSTLAGKGWRAGEHFWSLSGPPRLRPEGLRRGHAQALGFEA
eukprot:12891365-Alexandrium_andersonii.AAC.1